MGVVFARVTHPCQPSPIPLSGRPAHRPFRGLLSVYLRCGLHTRTVTVCRDRYPKASDTSSPPCLLRSLPAGAVAGWGLHPLEKRRLVTAHVEDGDWLRGLLRRLQERHEAGNPTPWRVQDLPETYLEGMLKGIIGLDIAVTRLEGKFKLSQNRPAVDRPRVIAALERQDDENSLAVARSMREREPT